MSGRSKPVRPRTRDAPKRTPYVRDRIRSGQRSARLTRCPKCSQDVYVGLDGHVLAMTATTEAYPATAADEALARGRRTGGRPSYELAFIGSDAVLTLRHAWTARDAPGEPQLGGWVVLAHDCTERPRPLPPEPEALFDLDGEPPY